MLGLPVYYLISSVVCGVEVRPPLGDLGRALLSRSVLILLIHLRGHPGVAPWLSHAGLAKFEGGLGHELAPIKCGILNFILPCREYILPSPPKTRRIGALRRRQGH